MGRALWGEKEVMEGSRKLRFKLDKWRGPSSLSRKRVPSLNNATGEKWPASLVENERLEFLIDGLGYQDVVQEQMGRV